MRFGKIAAVLVLAFALALPPFTASSHAAQVVRYEQPIAGSRQTGDVQQLEDELEMIFEKYLHQGADGVWFLNVSAVHADGAPEEQLRQIVKNFNSPSKISPLTQGGGDVAGYSDSPNHRIGRWAWGKCVLGFVIPGSVEGGLTGSIISWLQKGKYQKVAECLIRVVGGAAIPGGVIGLVASPGAGVAWCSTPWV